jgi:hypothetical protein
VFILCFVFVLCLFCVCFVFVLCLFCVCFVFVLCLFFVFCVLCFVRKPTINNLFCYFKGEKDVITHTSTTQFARKRCRLPKVTLISPSNITSYHSQYHFISLTTPLHFTHNITSFHSQHHFISLTTPLSSQKISRENLPQSSAHLPFLST